MNADLIVIIVGILSFIIGGFLGGLIFKIHNRKLDKKLLKNAKEVLSGRRKNKIKIDGEEYDATKFLLRDEDGKKILIDLQKGGGIIQDGGRQEDSTGIKEVQKQEVKVTGEAGEGSREKKRVARDRSILSRIRRFG